MRVVDPKSAKSKKRACQLGRFHAGVVYESAAAIDDLQPVVEVQRDSLRGKTHVVPGVQHQHGPTGHARCFEQCSVQKLNVVGNVVEDDYIITLVRKRQCLGAAQPYVESLIASGANGGFVRLDSCAPGTSCCDDRTQQICLPAANIQYGFRRAAQQLLQEILFVRSMRTWLFLHFGLYTHLQGASGRVCRLHAPSLGEDAQF